MKTKMTSANSAQEESERALIFEHNRALIDGEGRIAFESKKGYQVLEGEIWRHLDGFFEVRTEDRKTCFVHRDCVYYVKELSGDVVFGEDREDEPEGGYPD